MMIRSIANAAFALALLAPPTVLAASQRTFVASSGADGHPCTLSQPCRSFAVALAATNPGGEVIVLDSAGYGPVTIAQSVSIIAPAGVYAGISVFFGNGVTVDGGGISVLLRGLSINGQGGDRGVVFRQGNSLTLEDGEITNLTVSGIELTAPDSRVTIKNVVVRNQFMGVMVHTDPGAIRATIVDSVIADNAYGVLASATLGALQVSVSRTILTGNGIALQAVGIPGAAASILADGNTVTYSTLAFQLGGDPATSALFTAGNNTVGFVGQVIHDGVLTSCCAM